MTIKISKPSDYGIQLQAKQTKMLLWKHVKQFRKYKKAIMKKGDTAENLIIRKKIRRCDQNYQIQQLINHGHVS